MSCIYIIKDGEQKQDNNNKKDQPKDELESENIKKSKHE